MTNTIKNFLSFTILFFLYLSSNAQDQDFTLNPDNNWFCGGINNLPFLSFNLFGSDRLLANNFYIDERSSFMVDSSNVVEFGFSIVNRTNSTAYLNVQLYGLSDNGSVIIALEGGPIFDMVTSNENESVQMDSYVTPNIVSNINTICLQFFGEVGN